MGRARITSGGGGLGLQKSTVYRNVQTVPFSITWPAQITGNVSALIGKPVGGCVACVAKSYITKVANVVTSELDGLRRESNIAKHR